MWFIRCAIQHQGLRLLTWTNLPAWKSNHTPDIVCDGITCLVHPVVRDNRRVYEVDWAHAVKAIDSHLFNWFVHLLLDTMSWWPKKILITMTSQWASWRLTSPTTRRFKLAQKNIKVRYWFSSQGPVTRTLRSIVTWCSLYGNMDHLNQ